MRDMPATVSASTYTAGCSPPPATHATHPLWDPIHPSPPPARAHHPVERVVAAVADVDGDAAVRGVKHGVAGVALHVVGGLVEVAHARNVVLVYGKRMGG